ncbi:MAG: gliding motility-associated C-terminal domain-containing protein [Bacteroidales bacterium]|nr:gliding motility-associated C-terminal domain-containing protein [Bacteroidales bacterium]
MLKRVLIFVSIGLIIHSASFAQYPGKIWYFGEFAGLDFNTTPPTPLANGMVNSGEGCATMSDVDGNIIFYTDGVTVWNKSHEIMQNGEGLFGHHSSTQTAIIVKQPGNNPIYYIFTTDYFAGPKGLNYSIVDISLDNGLGEVIEKNIQLLTPVSEKLTVVSHSNGIDYWVIAHKYNSTAFYTYLINESGIYPDPVINNTGTTHQGGGNGVNNALGYLRVSPSNEKLAVAIYDIGNIDVLNFDGLTGNIQIDFTIPSHPKAYGVEFSPNNQLLYVKSLYSGKIYQYNLMAGSVSEILASKILVGEATNTPTPVDYISGALQLGLDEKIYVVKYMDDYLGRIGNPNVIGVNCNFVDDAFYLQGKKGLLGFPYAGQTTIFSFQSENYCFNDTTFFWPEGIEIQNIDSVVWNFDDPASGNENSSTLFNTHHIFTYPGTFEVQLIIYFSGEQFSILKNITIHPLPEPELGNDTIICGSQQIVLNPGEDFETYLWQDGSTEPALIAGETGLYWVEVSNAEGCINRDSIQITFSPGIEISIGNDTTYCFGDTNLISAGSGFESYLWQDGSTDSTFMASQSGTYWVEVIDEYGCFGYDTINLTFLPSPDISFGNDTLICFDQTLSLNVGEGFDNILWQDGSQGQSFLVTEPGLYWVNVSNDCGLGGDTISVEFSEPFDISLGNDTSFCYGQSYMLDAGEGFLDYLWNDGSQTRFNEISSHGFHWVKVSDSLGCTATDSVFVEVYNAFEISLGNDTTHICEGEYIFLNGPDGFEFYLWQDGSDYPSILADTAGTYWLEVTDENGCAARDSMVLVVNIIPENLLGNDTVICPGGEITIQATEGFSNYVWHDGSQNQSFTTNHEGIFWLTVQDDIGCAGTDTIKITDFEIPGLGLAGQEWLCPDDTLLLDAGGGYLSYLWSDGSQNQTLQVFNAGNYAVEVETVCGLFSDTIEIKLYQGNLDLGNDTILCDGEILYLNPGNNYSNFHWSNGSSDSTILVKNSGTYWLKAFDGFCNVSDSITIDACAEIWIPNVFTPNSDGHNDTFFAETENPAGIINFKMVIFNRWGRIVHTLENINDAWDGKINGSTAAEGVYFWECDYSARDKTGKINFHSKQGSVTLMR